MADLATVERVHLVGVGGSGMAALATLLLRMDKQVSGSDVADGPVPRKLSSAGATVHLGHAAEQVGDAEMVVRSSAVPDENPEVAEAMRRGIRVVKLAEAVGELMRGRSGVAIAGTHGKTTTTALVTWLLDRGGVDPLALIGADTPAYAAGARLGDGPMVVEADEYDRRFLSYWPEVAVVTSVEADHLDYYSGLDEIRGVFQELVDRLPREGRLVVCADEPCASSLATRAQRDTYGFAKDATWRIDDYVALPGQGSQFTLHTGGRGWRAESSLVGEHNARNAAAAVAVADYFGVGLSVSVASLRDFAGTRRRFETRGRPNGVWVVDDYAHHPTALRATLRAARQAASGRVWAIFQPHTTNRTAALLDEFARAFESADHALILPIYRPSGREVAAREVTSADVVARVRATGHPDTRLVEDFAEAREAILTGVSPGDLVLTLGAGDVTQLSNELVAALESEA